MSNPREKAVKEPLIHLTRRSGMFFLKAWGIRILAVVLGLVFCGLVAFILVPRLQQNPGKIGDFYAAFWKGSFSTARKSWKFFKDLAILLCISLALTPAFRMRFWNTGAEGQTLMGVWGAIAVNFYWGGKMPEPVLLVLMFLAALGCGALWGVIPALFKAKWNTNETLFTLMMNYVASFIVAFFLVVWVPNGSSTLARLSTGKLPSFGHEYLVIILTALLLTVLMHIYIHYTKHGYELNVVGESVRTAKYVGIGVGKVIIRTMIVSGALCGLAGFLIGAGLDQTITADSVGGRGFTAIMVCWLAKFSPIGMIATSGVITLLDHGASQISQDFDISGAFPDVVVGIILFFIIGSEFFINYKVHFRGRAAGKEAVK